MKTRYTKLQSKEEIRKFVEQFITDFGDEKNPHRIEAQIEEKYIKLGDLILLLRISTGF